MKETLVFRNFYSDKFFSKELNEKFKLEDILKYPIISEHKEDSFLMYIGICTKESINTPTPVLALTHIIIDYDNKSNDKYLIDKFEDKFYKYSYYLYTTFNYKKQIPRFRVIFPLKNILNIITLNNKIYVDYLMELFKIDNEYPDESCFKPSQGQLYPIAKAEYLYKYKINVGKKLKLKKYTDVINKNTEKYIESFKDSMNKIKDIIRFGDEYVSINDKIRFISKEEILSDRENFKRLQKPNILKRKYIKEEYKKEKENVKIPKQFRKKSLNYKFKNKHSLLKYCIPLIKSGKMTQEEFKERWKINFNEEFVTNKKWVKKYNDFLDRSNAK